MKYVFGPVPSWRLGQSLGVDPVPLKTCNWNCVYCQLGRSRPVVNRRAAFVPADAVIAEVKLALAGHDAGQIDWVTFVGSGETLLHVDVGWMIREVQAVTDIPVAVLTNGSLLCQPGVRREIEAAEAVLPSLDAGTEQLYRTVNRPHPGMTFERHTEGLVEFRDGYDGLLWVEVMLVRGVNDGEREVGQIAALLARIRPDEIHVNRPARSPVEPWVECPHDASVIRAARILQSVAPVRVVSPAKGEFSLAADETVVDVVLQVVTRHPLSQSELESILAQSTQGRVPELLEELEGSDKVQKVKRLGTTYWVAGQAHFPDSSAEAQESEVTQA